MLKWQLGNGNFRSLLREQKKLEMRLGWLDTFWAAAERYGYAINWEPKPLGKELDWNGSGMHANFSVR